MAKIQYNGQQYTVTISPEHIERMGWKKGTKVYITKDPERELLYIEELPNHAGEKIGTKRKNT